jgi:predicted ATP-grasp superfamily ATP-dependent carboligase
MNLNWELIRQVLSVIVPLAAAIPGIYAIRRQLVMEKVEKKKLILEAESISADVAAKLIDSAGDLQEFYGELFIEVRKQLDEQKKIVCRLEGKIDLLTKENENLHMKIEGLCKQVRELGQEPRYSKG